MGITDWLLELLFPSRCAFCGRLTGPGQEVWRDCAGALPRVPDGQVLRRAGDYDCAVAFYYDGPVREGVLGLKFHNKPWRARVFGGYIAQTAAEHLSGRFDAVTYVPVSWQRRYRRGLRSGPAAGPVRRQSLGRQGGTGPAQDPEHPPSVGPGRPRLAPANVRDAYAVPRPERVRGRRFLLIDDVCTTGSTLAACAGALMAAGAESVVCAALAGGHAGASEENGGAEGKSSEKVM